MQKLFRFETGAGPFYIAESSGNYHPVFKGESLGSYATPQQAVDDLAGGHTFTPVNGEDTASLGIPGDLGGWEKLVSG